MNNNTYNETLSIIIISCIQHLHNLNAFSPIVNALGY